MLILFLDFDGVLRRKNSPLYKLETNLVTNFEEALRAFPEVRIVITSSWREAFGLNEIRMLFSTDIAVRILGFTPRSLDLQDFYRFREVLAYLKRFHTLQTPWMAVDDDPEHYPHDAPVLLVDPTRGLDAEMAIELRVRLANCMSKVNISTPNS
ncbi:MAG: hypothetical protein KA746_11865 [Pyrinomonadaceae bacterium]|nr:hypothetical protein [Pyrinomonadaceae bacterium]MBP6211689.1 hypothetical protein [Pyrinomonadaceae bacterium]